MGSRTYTDMHKLHQENLHTSACYKSEESRRHCDGNERYGSSCSIGCAIHGRHVNAKYASGLYISINRHQRGGRDMRSSFGHPARASIPWTSDIKLSRRHGSICSSPKTKSTCTCKMAVRLLNERQSSKPVSQASTPSISSLVVRLFCKVRTYEPRSATFSSTNHSLQHPEDFIQSPLGAKPNAISIAATTKPV